MLVLINTLKFNLVLSFAILSCGGNGSYNKFINEFMSLAESSFLLQCNLLKTLNSSAALVENTCVSIFNSVANFLRNSFAVEWEIFSVKEDC